jgi:glycosyltransferase involved in cell wall biosynthesis
LLRANRIDVLQTHLFDAAIVGILAGRLARVPLLIVTRHHLDQHHLLGRRVHVELDRLTARMTDHVIVPAAAVKDHMVTVENLEPARIEVIPHGLDLGEFAPRATAGGLVREEFGLDGAFVVGYVGWLDPAKGLPNLLAAAGALRGRIDDLRVLVLGDHPDPAIRQGVVSEIERRGLGRKVILAGHRSDVAACMQAMDVLAHPSQSEALPQVLIEAMAVGTPVVASSVGGIPEIVEAGKTGILVPPGDCAALAIAIEGLYRNPGLRERYAQASVVRARSHFSAAQMVQRHLDCYSRWLAENR